jgi:hypothetical protein
MIARTLAAAAALAALALGGTPLAAQNPSPAAGSPAQTDTFPHARHAKLFTTCDACHSGITTGDTATFFPPPELCAGCHNGDLVRAVTWRPHPLRPTNVAFDHVPHVAMFQAMDSTTPLCQRCHAHADSLPFMNVGRADPARCVTCHGEGATSHLTQASCGPCHTTLRDAAALDTAQIRAFPKPPSHDSAWILHHQTAATGPTCAVCHAQQFCASCHVNAALVPAIESLPPDNRVAAMLRGHRVTAYPRPASHLKADWDHTHGAVARRSVAECANCHAEESCIGCHRVEERVPALAALPHRKRGGAFGVDLAGLVPSDHLPDMALRHRALAAGGTATCGTCHRPSYCASCHDAARRPSFHGPDFVQRHAQQAYTSEAECASCHQTQVFCRACHLQLGRASSTAPIGPGKYHDNQPGWLFGHGGVARRSIETCASCHGQDFCLRCHSATTGWHINPHGPGFDPRVQSKNPAMCLICHTTGVPAQ